MQLGMVGLGRMGANMTRRLMRGGHIMVVSDLSADEISTDRLNQLLNPNPPKRPWYRFSPITPESSPSFLTGIRANGTLTANRVVIRNLVATQVVTKVDLDRGKLWLSDLRAHWRGASDEQPSV